VAKVYIFLADGFEEIEALTVVDSLRRASIDIVMISITGNLLVTGAHRITTVAEALFNDMDFSDADMLVLPGGMPGTINLEKHFGLDTLLKDFAAKNKKIAAICAAPRVLGTKGLLEGKKATCYPGNEEALLGAEVLREDVVVDGNIITSRGMGTAMDFSLAIIRKLKGAEKAKEVSDQIQYRHYME
jgi:4-methyl-5(b-hydroxyethyl)-thiazole monophosphate biosynthesis